MNIQKKIYYKTCLVLEHESYNIGTVSTNARKKYLAKILRYAQEDDTLNMYMQSFRGKYSIAKKKARIEGGNRRHYHV